MSTEVKKKLKGKDILLLLLYLPGTTADIGESINGTTRLVKAFFLFEKEAKNLLKIDTEKMPEFISWKYGPWSRDIFDYVDFFEQIGFLVVNTGESKNDNLSDIENEEICNWQKDITFEGELAEGGDCFSKVNNIYKITDVGIRYVEEKIIPSMSASQIKIIEEFKKKINSLSLYTILKYVYKKYGENNSDKDWTDKSEIKSQVIN